MSGACLGAYGWNYFIHAPAVSMMTRGFCADQDPSPWRTVYYYRCKDSFIAAQLQQSAMEVDAASVGDPIGDIIRASDQPKKKRK